jgi:hypothetical protein
MRLVTLTLWLAGVALAASVASAAEPRTVEDIVAEVRRHTVRYLDIAKAREDGFVQASGMEARHGYHFINVNAQIMTAALGMASGELNLARPPMLIYVERDGAWQLAGVEYALPSVPAANPFPGAQWHTHEPSCHYRDYRELPAARASECPPRHPASGAEFSLWHPAFAVVHVWAWYPNPAGPFATENAYLAPYGGAPHVVPGHRHARSAQDAMYSEWHHRTAGAFLLLLAAVVAWESWRPRRLPWNALSAPVWVAFGVYMVYTSDPESWPWGPKRFLDVFGDPEVLQHKTLSLIPILIGIVGALKAFGYLPGFVPRTLIPAVAALGGFSLLFHLHDGRFHLDAIYLQHAVMGLTGLGLATTLFLARRSTRGEVWVRWAWPAFLGLMSLVLMLYSEL